jgi:gliding motility-associated-like protein
MKSSIYGLKAIILLTAILFAPVAYAQWDDGLWTGKQANNWFFSFNQGLSFETGSPQLLTGGQTAIMEGSAVMSDSNGQLLFYASNGTIWNSNHAVMLNGDNLLASNQSSTQSGIIVPKPGNPGIYYLFNIDTYDGLVYSEIDMSLDNGLGGVTATKNISLEPNAKIEKITAVYHADKERIWVISHRQANNEFIAYLISSSGIPTQPVVSATGLSYTTVPPVDNITYLIDGPGGQLKASPDGSKLAAVQSLGTLAGISITNGTYEVFDFNTTTGQISNPIQLHVPHDAYSVEFSPDSKMLYMLDNLYLPNVGFLGITIENVMQVDLSSGNAATIAASMQSIGQYTSRYMSALQLGPDGRIYFVNTAGQNTLLAVKSPNNLGTAAGYQAAVLTLPDNDSLGLPSFIQSYFESGILYEQNCGEVTFSLLRIPDVTDIAWNFGDPNSGAANTSSIAAHTFSAPGTYTVTAQITSNGGIQTATKVITVTEGISFPDPQPLTACTENGSATFNLTVQDENFTQGNSDISVAYYTSQANAEAGTQAIATPESFINTQNPQTIYALVTNTVTGCSRIATFTVAATPAPAAPQAPNLQACDDITADGFTTFNLSTQDATLTMGQPGITVSYFTSQANAEANTTPVTTPQSFINTVNPQTLYARISNSGGCFSTTSFQVMVNPQPVATTPAALQLCDNDPIDGSAVFNLSIQNELIIAGQPGISIAYFTSQAGADANSSPIANPEEFTNTINPQTIFARLTNASGCYSTTSFEVRVNTQPVATAPPALQQCDDTTIDGLATFNLSVQDTAIVQGQTGTISYFTSAADADANTNALPNPQEFSNTENPQVIFARISNGSCYATTSFTVQVLAAPVLTDDLTLTGCPPFNITSIIEPSEGITYSYYSTQEDAESATNAIANPATYMPQQGDKTVYLRAENAQGCAAVAAATLTTDGCDIPKGISPNNDGKNDVFDLSTLNVEKLSIYNRYGLEVYSNTNYTSQWHGQQDNGNELPTGTYYYFIQRNNGEKKTGWVYVMREIN